MTFQYNNEAIKQMSRDEFLGTCGDAFRKAGINPEEHYDSLATDKVKEKKKSKKK